MDQVQTALIVYNNWVSQEIRIYDEARIVEMEWIVGPIPIEDNYGKEIIMRYDTDIQSNGMFYTDANGREVIERKRDYRSSFNYTVYENVSGNYGPVVSRIWIKDNQRQMTVLTGIKNKFLFLENFKIKFLELFKIDLKVVQVYMMVLLNLWFIVVHFMMIIKVSMNQ